jgi:hypothetical protein
MGSSTGQVANGVLTISEAKYTDGTCSTLLSGTEQTTLPATCSNGYQYISEFTHLITRTEATHLITKDILQYNRMMLPEVTRYC